MSNEAKMTLEEKLVQRIKSETLMAAFGDEDMLNELVRRALNEALFQERTVGSNYNTHKEASMVVKAASKIAQEACDKVAKDLFVKVVEAPEVKAAIVKALPFMVQQAMESAIAFGVRSVISAATDEASTEIRNAIQQQQL